jgi:hypothetical protein
MAGRAVPRARCDSDHIAFPLLFHQRVLIKRLRGTDRHGGTIPPRAELLTSNASVVFTGVSALANLNAVLEQHLEDLSAIDIRANEPKLPFLLECKSCAAAYRTIILRTSPGAGGGSVDGLSVSQLLNESESIISMLDKLTGSQSDASISAMFV